MPMRAEDLFMNIWHSKTESLTDGPWDAEYKYWGRIWLECKNLARHLQKVDELDDRVKESFNTLEETPMTNPFMTEEDV